MSRGCPYQHRPPPTWDDDIEKLQHTRLLLVSQPGPTAFVLKADDDLVSSTFKVIIGENQMCSCGYGAGRGRLCTHILFVMIKVLKIPKEDPLVYQLSLTPTEVDKICTGEMQQDKKQLKHSKFLRKGQGKHLSREIVERGESDECRRKVMRKDLLEDDTCGICQSSMTDIDALCYCTSQCGTNFHTRCFRMYASYNRTNKKPILCPICRSKWGEIPSAPPKKIRRRISPINCSGECKGLIRDEVYRCASCSGSTTFNLCRPCFEVGTIPSTHANCCFVKSPCRTPYNWAPAIIPGQLRTVAEGMMHRDLTSEDYDLLLDLEDRSQGNLASHLLNALRSVRIDESNKHLKCVICDVRSKSKMGLKSLGCHQNHVAHESCILEILIEYLTSERLGAPGAECPQCHEYLFPSLVDQLKKNTKNVQQVKGLKRNVKGSKRRLCKDAGKGTVPPLVGLSKLSLNGQSIQTEARTKACRMHQKSGNLKHKANVVTQELIVGNREDSKSTDIAGVRVRELIAGNREDSTSKDIVGVCGRKFSRYHLN